MRTATFAVCALLLSAGCLSGGALPVGDDRAGTETVQTPKHPQTPSSSQYDVDVDRIENLIHQKMNDRRREHGVDPLARNETLDAVARYKSWDMAQRDYFAHTGPNGTLHSVVRERYGTRCGYTGQNIYYDKSVQWTTTRRSASNKKDGIAKGAVNLLLNSSGHRENALDPNYDSQGIGVFVDENGSVYVTQELCG